ncbi:MAG TPA: beta-L-arabinofuranosidase domain-containing protein [Sphingomonas sp.]|nr:beta-L-arabinofuranosidase domain-containing protein [Sphingomonas sp.]
MKSRRDVLAAAGTATAGGLLHPVLRAALVPLLAAAGDAVAAGVAGDGFAIRSVPFSEVTLDDTFWAPRMVTQQRTLVPFALGKVEPAIENLRRTAAFQRGEKVELLPLARYVSSDLYKVMEGAAYLLKVRRDPALEAHMDAIIETIAAAQSPDGYLFEDHIVGLPKGLEDDVDWVGDKPYSLVVQSHELYCMGHMYEAAIAYFQATGKRRWLGVAEKSARHINRVFFVGDPAYNGGKPVNQAPGHEEIELALAKLYLVTGDRLYLDMAKRFLDIRGVTYVPHGEAEMAPTYAQQQAPVAEQRHAVGHAVRAGYLYSGMAEVGALTGHHDYDTALDAIWHDIVDTKMHITGGLGAVRGIEGFGPAYDLPNAQAYDETCAAVANVLFNMRMFRMTGDARFADVAEVALFNNALAGVNLEGNRFFYVNPLESDGKTGFNSGKPERVEWFNTACCPSNLARLIPQVSGLMYGHEKDTLFVTLYGSGSTEVPLDGGTVAVEQRANYPFDGTIAVTLTPARAQRFALKLRVPTWARGAGFVPGALYRFVDEPGADWSIAINGKPVTATLDKGFAVIERDWRPGDTVTLTLPMPVRFTTARPEVEADRGRVAVTRGPLVLCTEGADNGDALAWRFDALPERSSVSTGRFDTGKLAGILRVEMPATRGGAAGRLTMLPYYAWNNRGPGTMAVWLPRRV